MTPASPLTAALVILGLAVALAFLVWADSPSRTRRRIHAQMERAHRREDAATRRMLDGPKGAPTCRHCREVDDWRSTRAAIEFYNGES